MKNITKKEQIEPLHFYYWHETFFKADSQGVNKLLDICFIIYINKTSSPFNWQCDGIEIESINSDLVVGNSYNYHYMWGERKISDYMIKQLDFEELTHKQKSIFWDFLFDENSNLFNSINNAKLWGKI